ncbi:MAG: response regulator transcription factor [bacterium]|nr:response regulator transcription factor [bacterium]
MPAAPDNHHSETLFVSIVEDRPASARRLRRLIESSDSFRFLKHYDDAESALAELSGDAGEGRPPDESAPAMILIDLQLPGMHGSQLIEKLRASDPDLLLVVITVFEDERSILEAIRRGANGYLLKDTPDPLLLAELNVLRLGGGGLTGRVAARILELAENHAIDSPGGQRRESPKTPETPGQSEAGIQALSQREREVVNFIALGFKYSEIADELNISGHTVRRHIEKIYRKLEVSSRSQAILKSKRIGYLHD